MKEYRNVNRSKKMIKKALLDLLKTKPIAKITIRDIVDSADLSRNTFYAHYQDIYSVLEEIENEVINYSLDFLNTHFKDHIIYRDSLNYFIETMEFANEQREAFIILLDSQKAPLFIEKMRKSLISCTFSKLSPSELYDKKGFETLLNFIFSGIISLTRASLNNEIDLSLRDIAVEANNIFLNCYSLYIDEK